MPTPTQSLARPFEGGAFDRPPRNVAVVIPCHNYGRYLAEAIESALHQNHRPQEIVVVDDASTDDTRKVAARFKRHGVRYLRVKYRNSNRARLAGMAATASEVLCFLDADDRLAADYLVEGLKCFDSYRIAVVYSDLQLFGDHQGRLRFADQLQRDLLERQNMIHSGSLVRRAALQASRALELADGDQCAPDWQVWRVLLRQGWHACKQPATYWYRRHSQSMLADPRRERTYFARAGLDREIITLFIPLAGRGDQWASLARFLECQTWPHAQIRLTLFDTSHGEAFSRKVRDWLSHCDYPDVRHVRQQVGVPGLADLPRREAADEVRLAMARIYNRLAREIATDYVWILEDDIRPPLDACTRLLAGFDEQTASVSAAYRSRYQGAYVAWDQSLRNFTQPEQGLRVIGGNGFGCVMVRGHVLRETVFTALLGCPDYDHAFYDRLGKSTLQAKMDWSLECEHLGS
ncbi:MAG: glycosyltransferase [Pirellulales bacterium]